ncbi:MAG: penicillin-insensitive murein endopeptidase [Rhodobacteraceae bacterium]|nr:penicillin-insensitive murein endopeptidase [Paracoccaceae bacterium]
MRKTVAALALFVLAACVNASAPAGGQERAATLFSQVSRASTHAPEVYGGYARGCADGLVQLPETGPTWQAMRTSRNRNWGHPEMISYLEDLSRAVQAWGWRGIYVGDISQPRGGPSPSGHLSHQTGLDADIWYNAPASLTLSTAQRESLAPTILRTDDQRSLTRAWTPEHARFLRAAASDPRVDRIFVAAAIKIELCRTATPADTPWLQRIRPLYGHHDHLHVRLRCPAGSRHCETQSPTVAELSHGGNGCDDTLTWWVTDYLNPPRTTTPAPQPAEPAQPRRRGPREFIMSDLPRQCSQVIERP